jgi:anti-sigma28 factor (negative regulator of flagellin synthesis)
MKQHTHEDQSAADLAALSEAALGQISERGQEDGKHDLDDPERAARVSELKAKYQAGTLSMDAAAIAAKLVDSHIQERPANARASSSQK